MWWAGCISRIFHSSSPNSHTCASYHNIMQRPARLHATLLSRLRIHLLVRCLHLDHCVLLNVQLLASTDSQHGFFEYHRYAHLRMKILSGHNCDLQLGQSIPYLVHSSPVENTTVSMCGDFHYYTQQPFLGFNRSGNVSVFYSSPPTKYFS